MRTVQVGEGLGTQTWEEGRGSQRRGRALQEAERAAGPVGRASRQVFIAYLLCSPQRTRDIHREVPGDQLRI